MCANLALVTAHPQKDNAARVRPLESEKDSGCEEKSKVHSVGTHEANKYISNESDWIGRRNGEQLKKALVFRLSYLFDFACDSHRIRRIIVFV